ncbi:MAG: site-specific integrase [Acidimicrobiia bacterium]|nr:site-specific integrase [Acidimicrobiia bacterium]
MDSARAVSGTCTIVRASLAQAVQWDRIGRNPADRATPPKAKRYEPSTWTPEQIRQFLDQAADHRLSAAWLLLATTGMRRSEVLGLRWSDVDLGEAGLHVRQSLVAVEYEISFSEPKTEKSKRRVALDPHTIMALRSHRARQSEEKLAAGGAYTDDDPVFADEIGRPLHPESLSQTFKRQAKAAGLPTIRLHDLRHSFATAALEAGVPLKVVSDRLGHSSISVTGDIYSHVSTGLGEDAAARVATAILG